jgi:hypothetical protein
MSHKTLILVLLVLVTLLIVAATITYAGEAKSKVWTDPKTGLTWQVEATGGKMAWSAAKAHCARLSLGGHHDWRLPTISELRSLIRGCPATRMGGTCGVTDSCLKADCWKEDPCKGCSFKGGPGPDGMYWPPELSGDHWFYWSSSPVAGNYLGHGAWGVHFHSGDVGGIDVSIVAGYAHCVRP